MATATEVRLGRPNKFDNKGVKLLKSVVRAFGLRKGQAELAKRGIEVSLPTLSKYVTSNLGGSNPIKLKRGRPSKSVAG